MNTTDTQLCVRRAGKWRECKHNVMPIALLIVTRFTILCSINCQGHIGVQRNLHCREKRLLEKRSTFMKNHNYVIIRIVLAVLLAVGIFGIQPAKAETVGFGWVEGSRETGSGT